VTKDLNDLYAAVATVVSPNIAMPAGGKRMHVAVVVTSFAGQWQEYSDYLWPLVQAGFSIQLFTVEGHPIRMELDSMLYSPKTAVLAFGSPARIAPGTKNYAITLEIAGNAMDIKHFRPSNYSNLFISGGLGTDRDLTFSAKLQGKVREAFDASINVISAICHGPTVLAHSYVTLADRRNVSILNGITAIGLPSKLEWYAIVSSRVPPIFQNPPPINVEDDLRQAGAKYSLALLAYNLIHQDNVVIDTQKNLAGQAVKIITGVGPLATQNLASTVMKNL